MPDLLFSLYLLLYFPIKNLWRSLRPGATKPTLPALQSYWRQGRFVLLLLGAFTLVAWHGKYTVAALGLALPLPPAGACGLALACALLIALYFVGQRMERKMTPEARIKQVEQLRDLPFPMPRTRLETTAFVVTMVGMTATWELLFRGYLLLVLTPVTGLPLAVALAAIAYGAGHGYKNPKQFAGSIAAAFAFTIGYALTGSLWWLIVLHAAAPVSMLFAVRKIEAAKAVEAVDDGTLVS